MDSNVPIPTYNIYKFCTSFGFIMVVAATLVFSYVIEKYDEPNVTHSLELELLKAKEVLSRDEIVRKSLLESVIARNKSNERFILIYLAIFGAFGGLYHFRVAGHGFVRYSQNKMSCLIYRSRK
jgi:hypothetical protein